MNFFSYNFHILTASLDYIRRINIETLQQLLEESGKEFFENRSETHCLDVLTKVIEGINNGLSVYSIHGSSYYIEAILKFRLETRYRLESEFKKKFDALSVRTKNIIQNRISNELTFYNYFETISRIGSYDLTRLKSAGIKTVNEITYFSALLKARIICEIGDEEINRLCLLHEKEKIINQYSLLDLESKLRIESKYHLLLGKLSIRSTRFIESPTIIQFIERYIDNQNWKATPKVHSEMSTLVEQVIAEIKNSKRKTNEQSSSEPILVGNEVSEFEKFIDDFSKERSIDPLAIFRFESSYYENRLPLFRIFLEDYLHSSNVKAKYRPIFFRVLAGVNLSLIGNEFDITKERVRQISSKSIVDAISNYFSFSERLSEVIVVRSAINNLVYSGILEIHHIRDHYFEQEWRSQMTSKWFDLAINIFLSRKFQNIDGLEGVMIEKRLAESLDVDRLIEHLKNLDINSRFNQTISINQLSANYCKPSAICSLRECSDAIICLAMKIIKCDVVEDKLVFKTNRKIAISAYIEEVLKNIGRPAHIDEILAKCIALYSDRTFSRSQIASNVRKVPGIRFFGRSSTYGLLIWETFDSSVKGGTIRDIVEEYLNDFDVPKHISRITIYVNKYRATSEYNLMSNIKLEAKGRFIHFKCGFIGLASKKYDTNKISFLYFFENSSRIVSEYFSDRLWKISEVVFELKSKFKMTSEQAQIWTKANRYRMRAIIQDERTIQRN